MAEHEDKKQKVSDPGMKWVVVADILGAIVIGLLVWASFIERNERKQDAQYAATEAQEVAKSEETVAKPATPQGISYDFDLKLTPQVCEGVEGNVDAVMITDANYMDFTRVAINSAKKTKCSGSHYNFYVMTMDLSESDVSALKALEDDSVKIEVLPQKEIDLFYIRDTHVSKTSLLKYYIANVLPQLDKVLYLDTDILVLHDLTELFETDVHDVYLAAVKDPSWFFENGHVVELNLDDRGFYFNTGVMLMNLAKIREDGLVQKLEDFTNNNFRTYMDQDALNVVVGDKVSLLPFENNAMNFFFEHVDLGEMAAFYGRKWQKYEDVFAPVTVLHFASAKKPLGPMVPENEFFRMLQRLWYKYYQDLPPLEE